MYTRLALLLGVSSSCVESWWDEGYDEIEACLLIWSDDIFASAVRMATEVFGKRDCHPSLLAAYESAPATCDPFSLVLSYYGVPDDDHLWSEDGLALYEVLQLRRGDLFEI